MKKKDIFNGNIKSVDLTKFTLIFGSVIFAACGILFICIAALYEKVDPAGRLALYIIGGVSIFLAVFLPIASLLLIRVYPKYSKLTFLLLKKEIFYTPEELEQNKLKQEAEKAAQALESAKTRKLIISRHKAAAACSMKMKVYLASESGDTIICGKNCKLLGTLANGEKAEFDIPQTKVKVYVICDTTSADWCNDSKIIQAGNETVRLSGKNKLSPLEGNPFKFD